MLHTVGPRRDRGVDVEGREVKRKAVLETLELEGLPARQHALRGPTERCRQRLRFLAILLARDKEITRHLHEIGCLLLRGRLSRNIEAQREQDRRCNRQKDDLLQD